MRDHPQSLQILMTDSVKYRKEKVKKIYLNFGCGFTDYESINAGKDYMIGIDGKETKFNHVYDGGDCFFTARYNLSKSRKFTLDFNY